VGKYMLRPVLALERMTFLEPEGEVGYRWGRDGAGQETKVYEVDPMICPKCRGTMKVTAFITEHAFVDRIIDHLKLTFVAAKPPPPHVFTEVALMEAGESGGYFMD